ncbi:hypothetical protein D3C76_1436820 [compost metagenome]
MDLNCRFTCRSELLSLESVEGMDISKPTSALASTASKVSLLIRTGRRSSRLSAALRPVKSPVINNFSGSSTSACWSPVAGTYLMFMRSLGATEPSIFDMGKSISDVVYLNKKGYLPFCHVGPLLICSDFYVGNFSVLVLAF